jgi:hypothetical protein
MVDGSALRADGLIADEADRFDATKAGITVKLRDERPSAPALRLLEPHALAAVTNRTYSRDAEAFVGHAGAGLL